jgi:hypothetical protein
MNFNRAFLAAAVFAAGTAIAGDVSDTLFNFKGVVGVQPFRSQAGAPVLNTVAGVPPGGAPWGMTSFTATIKNTGEIRARGTGVLLWGADGIGTPQHHSRAAATDLARGLDDRLERAHSPGRAARVHARDDVEHRRTGLAAERLHADTAIESEENVVIPVPVAERGPRRDETGNSQKTLDFH